MGKLDEPGDEINFELFESFGLDFFSDNEILLTETDLTQQTETTEQTEQTEIGQRNDEDIGNFITKNRNKLIVIFEGKWIAKPFFFSERVAFDDRNDRKLVQTCQSPVIFPFRFIQSIKEHLTSFRVVYGIRTHRISKMFWILLPENRRQNNNSFCSGITKLSFNGLTYNTREHFVHC